MDLGLVSQLTEKTMAIAYDIVQADVHFALSATAH